MTVVKDHPGILFWGKEQIEFRCEGPDPEPCWKYGELTLTETDIPVTGDARRRGNKWHADLADELTAIANTPQGALNDLRERLYKLTRYYLDPKAAP